MRRRLAFLTILFSAACGGSSSTGNGDDCGPETCDTCCTEGGTCLPAATIDSANCGAGGEQCIDCAGAVCESDGTCGPAPKRFFATPDAYTGDLASEGGAGTGLEGGDALCTAAGTAALPGSTWRAWLSDSSTDALDRITDVGPWFLFNGTPAFPDKASLADFPEYAVDFDAEGNQVSGEMWTGTDLFGMDSGDNCSDWEATAGFGDAATAWGSTTVRNCTQENHLFCIEQ